MASLNHAPIDNIFAEQADYDVDEYNRLQDDYASKVNTGMLHAGPLIASGLLGAGLGHVAGAGVAAAGAGAMRGLSAAGKALGWGKKAQKAAKASPFATRHAGQYSTSKAARSGSLWDLAGNAVGAAAGGTAKGLWNTAKWAAKGAPVDSNLAAITGTAAWVGAEIGTTLYLRHHLYKKWDEEDRLRDEEFRELTTSPEIPVRERDPEKVFPQFESQTEMALGHDYTYGDRKIVPGMELWRQNYDRYGQIQGHFRRQKIPELTGNYEHGYFQHVYGGDQQLWDPRDPLGMYMGR